MPFILLQISLNLRVEDKYNHNLTPSEPAVAESVKAYVTTSEAGSSIPESTFLW